MAGAAAEVQLNGFLDRQAAKVKEERAGQEHANALEAFWRDSERRHTERRRERNRWEWVRFYDRMARNHAGLAEEYERRAEALCQEWDAA